jgi:hypothetical protein
VTANFTTQTADGGPDFTLVTPDGVTCGGGPLPANCDGALPGQAGIPLSTSSAGPCEVGSAVVGLRSAGGLACGVAGFQFGGEGGCGSAVDECRGVVGAVAGDEDMHFLAMAMAIGAGGGGRFSGCGVGGGGCWAPFPAAADAAVPCEAQDGGVGARRRFVGGRGAAAPAARVAAGFAAARRTPEHVDPVGFQLFEFTADFLDKLVVRVEQSADRPVSLDFSSKVMAVER